MISINIAVMWQAIDEYRRHDGDSKVSDHGSAISLTHKMALKGIDSARVEVNEELAEFVNRHYGKKLKRIREEIQAEGVSDE